MRADSSVVFGGIPRDVVFNHLFRELTAKEIVFVGRVSRGCYEEWIRCFCFKSIWERKVGMDEGMAANPMLPLFRVISGLQELCRVLGPIKGRQGCFFGSDYNNFFWDLDVNLSLFRGLKVEDCGQDLYFRSYRVGLVSIVVKTAEERIDDFLNMVVRDGRGVKNENQRVLILKSFMAGMVDALPIFVLGWMLSMEIFSLPFLVNGLLFLFLSSIVLWRFKNIEDYTMLRFMLGDGGKTFVDYNVERSALGGFSLVGLVGLLVLNWF